MATLGGIAYYVQTQTIPSDRDLMRKPATSLQDAVEETPAPVMAWQDRVDFAELALVPFGSPEPEPRPGAGSGTGAGAGPDASTAQVKATGAAKESPTDPAKQIKIAPEEGLYVQDLRDGHRLLYTLDPVLQEAALTIFRNREIPYAGAVMLDLRDNAVLVMAGHSTLDPQVDPLEVVSTAWAPAASTFKLVTAASLLENHAATTTTKACFHGGLKGLTDELLKNNPTLDTRCETLSSAIAHSHNAVVGKLALAHLDEDQLTRTAHSLQFGAEIPFEFQIEPSPAHIPSDDTARAKVAAGFWHVDMSPIHGALLASIFARGGNYQPPHVIAQVIDPSGNDVTPDRPRAARVLPEAVGKGVGSMMEGTTTSGTARKSFRDEHGNDYVQGIAVAGKTGTLSGKREPYLNYNWFIGYAPADQPEIAFAVILANEPKWRIKAHYAARRLVQIYLSRRDAIAEDRSARLTATALVLPKRDPQTGAILPETPTPSNAKDAPPSLTAPEQDSAAAAAPDPKKTTAPLPPVPGPLPQVGE